MSSIQKIPARAGFPAVTWGMLVQNSQFSGQTYTSRTPYARIPVQQNFSLAPLFWTAGVSGLAALVVDALNSPAPRHCGTCGKTGHNTRNCAQNAAKRARLRMTKTGTCSCCKRHTHRTEAHHYAGPADGTKGREMSGACHLVCGHGGDWRNMAVNPRYCRL
jgi:hypothetical protein